MISSKRYSHLLTEIVQKLNWHKLRKILRVLNHIQRMISFKMCIWMRTAIILWSTCCSPRGMWFFRVLQESGRHLRQSVSLSLSWVRKILTAWKWCSSIRVTVTKISSWASDLLKLVLNWRRGYSMSFAAEQLKTIAHLSSSLTRLTEGISARYSVSYSCWSRVISVELSYSCSMQMSNFPFPVTFTLLVWWTPQTEALPCWTMRCVGGLLSLKCPLLLLLQALGPIETKLAIQSLIGWLLR